MREEPWVCTALSVQLVLHPSSPIYKAFSHVLADILSLCSLGTRLRNCDCICYGHMLVLFPQGSGIIDLGITKCGAGLLFCPKTAGETLH